MDINDKNHGTDDKSSPAGVGMGIELLILDEMTCDRAVERTQLIYLEVGWVRGTYKKQYRRDKFDRSG